MNREVEALLKWYKVLGVEVLFNPVLSGLFDRVENTSESINTLTDINKNEKRKTVVLPLSNTKNSVDLAEITEITELCKEINQLDCPIKRTARSTVIYDGDLNSKIMLIGEAPGYEEDVQGRPFVGQSGVLLNKMLNAIGLKRENVLITNTVFWRPPGNRNPAPEEISLCVPFVKRLVTIVNPRVIMLLGSVATHALLDTTLPISKLRGKLTEFMGIKTIPTYHPAYLLRNPSQKKVAYEDLLLLKKILDGKQS